MYSLLNTLLFVFIFSSLFGKQQREQQPEFSSGWKGKNPVYTHQAMVTTANPFATKVGVAILKKGGNAIDALIGIQAVLTLVEPQSSGIGGGAFLLYFAKETGKIVAYDGRETAPLAAHETFLTATGETPVIGGQSVGVPGVLKMLNWAHRKYGKLPWKELFAPAIELAENGFPISERLAILIQKTPGLDTFQTTRDYFFTKNGEPKPAGIILQNPRLAKTLRLIADKGISPFYHGKIAEEIVDAVRHASVNPGRLTLKDLAQYRPIIRRPLCFAYKNYWIATMPPPSSGGITLAQIMGMLEDKDLYQLSMDAPKFISLFCQASQLAYADRNTYLADPAFFEVPETALISKTYLKHRAKQIDPSHPIFHVKPGKWPCLTMISTACPQPNGDVLELPSTTHISIVDQFGNGASMTSSVENAFGSTLMVGGFLLNNQLTDFSSISTEKGKEVANRMEPGKRPLSSMTPTFVFHQGGEELFLSLGSAGGSRIIEYVAQALFGVLDFGLNIQEALCFPHFASITPIIELEQGTFIVNQKSVLEKMGYEVKVTPLNSGSCGIEVTSHALIGGVDPRREGLASGF
ncbi:MAG: gamma-glutamyltransferase [Chlamydiia bacterium]|nr:gamma-glutamyltransferase [Chlamydiia bacterium]